MCRLLKKDIVKSEYFIYATKTLKQFYIFISSVTQIFQYRDTSEMKWKEQKV